MILLEPNGSNDFMICGVTYLKGTVAASFSPDDQRVSFFHNGYSIFENVPFDEVALAGDPDHVPFTSPNDLRAWVDEHFYYELVVARPFMVISEATINAKGIKYSRGVLSSLIGLNSGQNTCYLKVYDMAGVPDPSADAGKCILVLPIPGVNVFSVPVAEGEPETLYNKPVNSHNLIPEPLRYYNGLGITITANPEPDDETAIDAGAIILSGAYK